MIEIKCPHCKNVLTVQIANENEHRIVQKIGGLAVNDVTSNHNLIAEQQKREQIRQWLAQPRTYGPTMGYSNLESLEKNVHVDSKRAQIMAKQRKSGFL